MRLRSPIPPKKARIEIIPLIDIMFFLLACFMLVSLNMVQLKSVKVAIPSSNVATPETAKDLHVVTVDKFGKWFWEQEMLRKEDLKPRVESLLLNQPQSRFLIRADQQAQHGEVIEIMNALKRAGVAKVSFELELKP